MRFNRLLAPTEGDLLDVVRFRIRNQSAIAGLAIGGVAAAIALLGGGNDYWYWAIVGGALSLVAFVQWMRKEASPDSCPRTV